MNKLTPKEIHAEVQARYGRIAEELKLDISASCCSGSTCSSQLYATDISWLPDTATTLSLGSGDPISAAQLQPGETVVDLGAGGGIDCLLAGHLVGPDGHVIGIDMTPAMLAQAEENRKKAGLTNVEFRQGYIEHLPIESESADVVISNCVINLSPDKTAVFREAFRVLKPGGRLVVSDIVTHGQFTPEQRADMAAWACCISGAEDVQTYTAAIQAAGFTNVMVQAKDATHLDNTKLPPSEQEIHVFSALVTAVKPEGNND